MAEMLVMQELLPVDQSYKVAELTTADGCSYHPHVMNPFTFILSTLYLYLHRSSDQALADRGNLATRTSISDPLRLIRATR